MASAHVELVRSIFAAWARGDYSSSEWADPNIEFVIAGRLTRLVVYWHRERALADLSLTPKMECSLSL